MHYKESTGHLVALFTIFIWGVTFISTKVLLEDFAPVEILFFRFVLGIGALMAAYPKILKGTTIKQELMFGAAGLCGICMYYLLENIALTYTMASNVGVIVSVAPFFTGILTHIVTKEEKLHINFFVGFIVAITGIFLISFNGAGLELNPKGDLLALLAAVVWAFYSVFISKISKFGYNTIQTTRRVFLYGLVLMIPFLFVFDANLELTRFTHLPYLFNIMFLGLGASALCFVTWNFSVRILGAVKTSVYIYIIPVITVISSVIILKEPITPMSAIGTALTMGGLFISEGRFIKGIS